MILCDDNLGKILKLQEGFIKERTNSKHMVISSLDKENFKKKTDFRIKDKKGVIGIK